MNQPAQPTPGAATVRAKTTQTVTNISVLKGEPAEVVYNRIFTRLETLYGVRVSTLPRQANESLLSALERFGWLDAVHDLAFAEQQYQQQYEE